MYLGEIKKSLSLLPFWRMRDEKGGKREGDINCAERKEEEELPKKYLDVLACYLL